MANPTWAFRPYPPTNTVSLSAGTASGNVALPAAADSSIAAGAAQQIQVYNAGSVPVFVNFGVGNTTAAAVPNGATPGDYPVAPGAVVVITTFANPTYAAAITSSGSATVYFTPGDGL